MANKQKVPIPLVTEFWVKDKRGTSGYILVNKFNGYIPVNSDMFIGGDKKSNGATVIYGLESTRLDILNGRYLVYLK